MTAIQLESQIRNLNATIGGRSLSSAYPQEYHDETDRLLAERDRLEDKYERIVKGPEN